MRTTVLVLRLAARDLRRRAPEMVLLAVALVVAAMTLTVALVLHGQTAEPFAATKQATRGPDVVATLFPAEGQQLTHADLGLLQQVAGGSEVTARSPAFEMAWMAISASGVHGVAEVQARDAADSPVDRPSLVSGRWVGAGGVVVERAFAEAMGVRVGDSVTLEGRQVPVSGIAVSSALPPYPQLCTIGCILDRPGWASQQPGLVWAGHADFDALRTGDEPVVWFQYLRLRDPDLAPGFAARLGYVGPPDGRPQLETWQSIAARQAETLDDERVVVVFGSTLLTLLALATLVVLVGGRMLDEVGRVGLLKAVGATPGFVTRLLLTSYLAVGLVAAGLGIVAGRVLAPHLVARSAGMLGTLGGTSVSRGDALAVLAVIMGTVLAASAVPAWRAARLSTVRALTDAGRSPHRSPVVTRVSARLPPSILLGLRLASRRPRRSFLTSASVGVAMAGSVVALYAQASLSAERGSSGGPADPIAARLHAVLVAVTLLLAVMTAVNLAFVARTTTVDARHVLGIARTVGATPGEVVVSLAVAQLGPALAGIGVGGCAGAVIFHALASSQPRAPSALAFGLLVAAIVAVVVVLTSVPARLEARRTVASVLRSA